MQQEDLELFLIDAEYASTLGIEAPRCTRCNGEIKWPPPDWNGKEPLIHLLKLACEWEKEH